jgi:hypothetical protein
MKTRLTQAFIIIALMFMSISVLAQDVGTDIEEVSDTEVCATFGEFAEVVHTARQSNMSISQMMGLMPEDVTEVERTILQGIILHIYEQPFFQTAQMISRQRVELRNEAELWCFQNI